MSVPVTGPTISVALPLADKIIAVSMAKSSVKSKICMSVLEGRACHYGKDCSYAHTEDELSIEVTNNVFKKHSCKLQGACKFKLSCNFLHQDDVVEPYTHPTLNVKCWAVKKKGIIYRLFLDNTATAQQQPKPVFPYQQLVQAIYPNGHAPAAQSKPIQTSDRTKLPPPGFEGKKDADAKKRVAETMTDTV